MNRSSMLCLCLSLSLSALLLASAATPVVAAEAYKCKGSKGEVVFSDQPCKDGEKIELKPVQTYTPAPMPAAPAPTAADKPARKAQAYQQVMITAPLANQEIRDNEGKITVSVALKPALQEGHQLRLLVDGQAKGPAAAVTSWELADVERGEHTVIVEVLDETGRHVASSDPVSFAVHRRSLLNKLQREREAEQREKDKLRIALPRTGPRN